MIMNMTTLSVVIPTKNEEDCLPRLLMSIGQQTVSPIEVIVADAESTDSTVEIANKFGARVVRGGLPGPGRNRGAEVATGELIFFLDADVELLDERFFEKAINDFESKKLDIATTNITPLEKNRYDRR